MLLFNYIICSSNQEDFFFKFNAVLFSSSKHNCWKAKKCHIQTQDFCRFWASVGKVNVAEKNKEVSASILSTHIDTYSYKEVDEEENTLESIL